MKRFISITFLLAVAGSIAYSQTQTAPRPQRPAATSTRATGGYDLSEFGVSFQTEPRLIVMMAALQAAGFDPGKNAGDTAFRAQVNRDLAGLDPELRSRLHTFYERNKLPAPATAADQAARYVSLAFALGPPPLFDAPERSEDLPASLLEVLDFAPLVKEFYRRSNIQENLPIYTRAYQTEGDRLKKPTAEMLRTVLSYLHTRPISVSFERVEVKPLTTQKKNAPKTYTTREHQRHFNIVPDVGSSRVDLQACKLEYSIVSPK